MSNYYQDVERVLKDAYLPVSKEPTKEHEEQAELTKERLLNDRGRQVGAGKSSMPKAHIDTPLSDLGRPPRAPTPEEAKLPTQQEIDEHNAKIANMHWKPIVEASEEKGQTRRSDTGFFQINDIVFNIPPEKISVQKEIKNVSMPLLRSSSTQKVRTGHGFTMVNVPLTFTSLSDVRLKLVPLAYALRRTPFCWIENKYLRKVLAPIGRQQDVKSSQGEAMMFALQSMTIQTVENLPTTVQCFLQLAWFNYYPYLRDIKFRRDHEYFEQPSAFAQSRNASESAYKREAMKSLDRAKDADAKVKFYNQLQVAVNDPSQSEPWKAFIKGHTKYLVDSNNWGPNIATSKYFNLEYRKYYQGENPPSGYQVEDPAYKVYYKDERFYSSSEFVPIHVSVGFQNRLAQLPLLEQQLPTFQHMGSSDRMCTITFFVTPAGSALLSTSTR